jgi:hypothetical protein
MFSKRRPLVLCLGIWLLAAGFGCSRGPVFEINPEVRGTLTMDGKPLANVTVQFVPEGTKEQPYLQRPLSTGATDERGKFDLTCDNRQPGAVIGTQRVVVIVGRSGQERDGEAAKPVSEAAGKNPPVPQQFTVASQTPYKLDVTKEQHDYKVDLSSRMGQFGK